MKKLSILIFSLIISSCISVDSDIFLINPLNYTENKLSLSKIADNVTYIQIDNTNPIGYIYSTKITKDKIYLSVEDLGLLAYNRDGEFLYNVGSKGRGPGEYVNGFSFAVGDEDIVYLIDNGNKIMIYNSKGIYIRSIYLNIFDADFSKIEYKSNMLFLNQSSSGGQLKYDWLIIDTLGNIIKQKITSTPSFKNNLGGWEGIYENKDIISFWNCYSDTVYSIYPNLEYKPTILFAQGEYRWPKSNITDFSKLGLYMQPHFLFETHNYIIFSYFYDNNENLSILNKASREIYLTYLVTEINSGVSNYKGGIINDIDAGIKFNPIGCIEENNFEYLIGFQNSYEFKYHITGDEFKKSQPKYPEKKKEFEKLAISLKDTDNPILVMVRLKK